ncbi:hypothetical protein HJ526_17305 [Donghicola sp. C2-DW-16]|uniref:Uncharacterized protein n=1 Tax=Donghicola mangrovi TaxID=2729614 RepID=A0ABX2PJK7_9RHOB|nr:hypothetical protein [Donghicola mangrovi]NVO29182.1 hypothetical protein [Donghicola mangrovi]
MIKISLSALATISYILTFLLNFFGVDIGIAEPEVATVMLYAALVGAGTLVTLILLAENGEDLTYPFLLTGLVSILAFFTIFLKVALAVLATVARIIVEADIFMNPMKFHALSTQVGMEYIPILILLFTPLASIFAKDAMRSA